MHRACWSSALHSAVARAPVARATVARKCMDLKIIHILDFTFAPNLGDKTP